MVNLLIVFGLFLVSLYHSLIFFSLGVLFREVPLEIVVTALVVLNSLSLCVL